MIVQNSNNKIIFSNDIPECAATVQAMGRQ